jgi:hypothetical protein
MHSDAATDPAMAISTGTRNAGAGCVNSKWDRELEYRLIKELWRSRTIASPSDLHTNGMMTLAAGSRRSAMRTGSSTRTV